MTHLQSHCHSPCQLPWPPRTPSRRAVALMTQHGSMLACTMSIPPSPPLPQPPAWVHRGRVGTPPTAHHSAAWQIPCAIFSDLPKNLSSLIWLIITLLCHNDALHCAFLSLTPLCLFPSCTALFCPALAYPTSIHSFVKGKLAHPATLPVTFHHRGSEWQFPEHQWHSTVATSTPPTTHHNLCICTAEAVWRMFGIAARSVIIDLEIHRPCSFL